MELHCPQCQHVLDQDNGHAYCPSCGKVIEMKALCPDCHQPLQVLKACGAVDYFCQHGHGLISKNALNSCWLNALFTRFFTGWMFLLHFLPSRLPDVWLAFHPL